jgi:N-glycosyltransferase StaG
MLPVVGELARRGHEIRWYTGRAYRGKVRKVGAGHEPMRAAYDFGGLSKEEAFPSHAGLTGVASFKTGMEDIFYNTAPDQMHDLLALTTDFPPTFSSLTTCAMAHASPVSTQGFPWPG